jgi:polysaccharide biosynthesis transport protein
LYNSLYAKIKEAGITAASKSGNIRIVDQARVLDTPTSPNRLLNFAVGLLAALVGGIALAFVREEFDNRIHTPQEMTNWVGRSGVAIIPVIDGVNGDSASLSSANGKNGHSGAFVLDRPESPESEAVQSLQTSIMLSQPNTCPQVLLVTSALPGEGKTTVALNLAISLTQQGETCLVDADLRKAEISSKFDLRFVAGMADVLSGNGTPESVFRTTAIPNLTVLPAGTARTSPAQLLCQPSMQQLLQVLRQRFRFVVIDSVPILPLADARALAPLADAVVFVGRAGLTTREAMRRSIRLLEEIHSAPVLEFVLNATELTSVDYKYGYASNYSSPAVS